jgi:hypothetical protein
MQQQNTITGLEQTFQKLKEQHVVSHIKFKKEKQVLITQIQDYKGQYEWLKYS